ncbi:glycoside hydrolase family 15 protein [Streptacidiphilus carbonis]|uniref:glycoside hydrolase family 15 protein n=1 Tax=Streptacidiphilus carbonis TaxID=105422 RepID=UPI0005A83E8E|nr:glycoside hydrolase family 15 protein [Streptacidiphilus carbonis]
MKAREASADVRQFPLHVLREYALLADGERGALVGPRGDIAWMCAPRWHSEAVFSTLIGGSGVFAVTPVDEPFVWGGSYEEGSLIWRSRWVTTRQVVECRDALAHPAQIGSARVLRRVMAVDGRTRVRVVLDPRAGFGRYGLRDLRRSDTAWTARCGPLHIRLTGLPEAEHRSDGGLQAELVVPAGGHRDLVLEVSERALSSAPPDAGRLWSQTAEAWARAVPAFHSTMADRDARHAYTVLRGLTSGKGGMVAGATTSLPERAEEGRNYDYRYAWIRDQCYAGRAVAVAGPHPLLDEAVGFVSDRILADGPDLRPAYTVGGGPIPKERSLKLTGYPGGAGKVGNQVSSQFQLDALGEALTLFAAAADHDRLDTDHWRAAEAAVAVIAERGDDPDAGIWELDDQRWTHSRLSCVAGLRAMAPYAPGARSAQWSALADRILADVSATCQHPTGRWQRSPDDERVDAALLIPALRGALPAGDPRTRATLAAVLDELEQDGYVYRFRQDERPLAEAEGAFLLCGFTTCLALHQQGRHVEAVRMFERNRAACGTPGLFAEEYDIAQRQLRGNLPQAFVHALLLESAHLLTVPQPGDDPAGR